MRLIGYGGMLTESFVAIMALITAAILNQHLYFAINAPPRRPAAPRRPRPTTSTGSGCPARRSPRSEITAGRRGRRRGVDRLPHRRRTDAGVRHVGGAAPGVRRRRASRRSGTTSRSCSRRCSSSPRSTPAPGWRASCCPTGSATSAAAAQAAGPELAGRRVDLQHHRGRRLGQHPADGCHRPARRHQHAVPAVRHRQPAARRHRADGRDRGDHQARAAEMGLDSRCSAAVGSDRDDDGVVAEDLLRRPEGRILDASTSSTATPRTPARRRSAPPRTPVSSTPSSATPSFRARCRSCSRCWSSSCSPPESSWRSRRSAARGRPLTEDEPVPSRIFAPSGMIPTKAEKEVQKQWDALPKSHARSVGTGAH